jgi:hypothetical protein
MQWTSFPILIAQATSDDLARELGRLQRNYQFLSYGLTAAWLILVGYVLMMVSRERRLKQEIARLRSMLEVKPGERQ